MRLVFAPAYPGQSIQQYAAAMVEHWQDCTFPGDTTLLVLETLFNSIQLTYAGQGGPAAIIATYQTQKEISLC